MQVRSENSIGFLRIALAALVLYSHGYFLGGFGGEPLHRWTGDIYLGAIAVQCFFVLSGWLVASSYQRSPSVWRFAWHRALRLLPAMWACLAFTAFALGTTIYVTSETATPFLAQEPGPIGYVWRNLVNPRTQAVIGRLLADNIWPSDLNGSLWTIFYEMAAYALVAAFGIAGLLTRFWRIGLALLVTLLAGYVIWSIAPAQVPTPIGRLYDTPGKVLIMHFVAGMIWALLPPLAVLRSGYCAAAAATLLGTGWAYGFSACISPWALTLMLFWLAEHLPFANIERRIGGDYSYGLYLYGYPIQQALVHFGIERQGVLIYGMSAFAIALALAVISWRLIERPALSYKHARLPLRRPAWARRAETFAEEESARLP